MPWTSHPCRAITLKTNSASLIGAALADSKFIIPAAVGSIAEGLVLIKNAAKDYLGVKPLVKDGHRAFHRGEIKKFYQISMPKPKQTQTRKGKPKPKPRMPAAPRKARPRKSTVVVDIPAAVGSGPKVTPLRRMPGRADVYSASVPVCQVRFPTSNSTFTNFYTQVVNPMNSTMYPDLALDAARYEKYRFRKLTFTYTPLTSTSLVGAIYMYVSPDAEDSPAASAQSLLYQSGAKVTEVFKSATCSSVLTKEFRYCNPNSGSLVSADSRLNNAGTFFVFLDGWTSATQGAQTGWITCQFEIEFMGRKTPQPTSLSTKSTSLTMTANSGVSSGLPWVALGTVATAANSTIETNVGFNPGLVYEFLTIANGVSNYAQVPVSANAGSGSYVDSPGELSVYELIPGTYSISLSTSLSTPIGTSAQFLFLGYNQGSPSSFAVLAGSTVLAGTGSAQSLSWVTTVTVTSNTVAWLALDNNSTTNAAATIPSLYVALQAVSLTSVEEKKEADPPRLTQYALPFFATTVIDLINSGASGYAVIDDDSYFSDGEEKSSPNPGARIPTKLVRR